MRTTWGDFVQAAALVGSDRRLWPLGAPNDDGAEVEAFLDDVADRFLWEQGQALIFDECAFPGFEAVRAGLSETLDVPLGG